MNKTPLEILVKKLINEGRLLLEQDEVDIDVLSAAIDNINNNTGLVESIKSLFKSSTLALLKKVASERGVIALSRDDVTGLLSMNGEDYVNLFLDASEITPDVDQTTYTALRDIFTHIIVGAFDEMFLEIIVKIGYNKNYETLSQYIKLMSSDGNMKDMTFEAPAEDDRLVFEIPQDELKDVLKLIANPVLDVHEHIFKWLGMSSDYELAEYGLKLDDFMEFNIF
jgi:hypothetical protein